MAQQTVKILIPFEALVSSVAELNLGEKRRLWEMLDEQLAQADEDVWERDPTFQSELREARAAFEAGDFVTISEYVARSAKKSE